MDLFPGLYIHIPFCIRKCRYCDFTSFSGCDELFEKYVDTVIEECKSYGKIKFETVFIGGGTPTVLPPYLLDKLLGGIEKCFEFAENCEASIEANPKTLDKEKINVLQSHIINRISIGVQSFNDDELLTLGRIHTSKDALECIKLVSDNYDNFNLDIMTALPNQSASSLMNTLCTAVGTGTSHLSCYSLILEEGTEFFRLNEKGLLNLPDEDADREMFSELCEYLKKNNYERYEISNFAKPGKKCKHNIKYWTENEYIGIGTAAHSYYNGARYSNSCVLSDYFTPQKRTSEKHILSNKEIESEYIMLALRTSKGINKQEFTKRFGKPFRNKKLEAYIKNGFMSETENNIFFTDKGFDVSNTILCELI